MKTGIFITARLGSKRLEKKHLLQVSGHPLLYFLIKRITQEFQKELINEKVKLLIVTSEEDENRAFEAFMKDGATVFHGSIHNIPLRHLQAAKAYSVDSIISVDGDDILCSVKGMRSVYDSLIKGAQYVKTSNLPFGMNSMGYAKDFLESSSKDHLEDTLETGWGRIFDQNKILDITIPFPVQDNALRFTLDYHEDYEFFKSVIEGFGNRIFEAQDEDIVNLVIDKKLYKINESISNQYWESFYKDRRREIQDSTTTH